MTEPATDGLGTTRAQKWRLLGPIHLAVFGFSAGEAALHVLVSPYLSVRLGLGAGRSVWSSRCSASLRC